MSRLTMTIPVGERIVICDALLNVLASVELRETTGGRAKLSVDADRTVGVFRGRLFERLSHKETSDGCSRERRTSSGGGDGPATAGDR